MTHFASHPLARSAFRLAVSLLILTAGLLTVPRHVALAQAETPTPTPTPTITPTGEPPVSGRPLVVFQSYSTSPSTVRPGSDFEIGFRLANAGEVKARNIVVIFTGEGVLPRVNGGVLAAGVLAPGASTNYRQPMSASGGLSAGSLAIVSVQIEYTDEAGTPYSAAFSLSIPIGSVVSPGGVPGVPKPTATPSIQPQLLISAVETDPLLLKPGTRFSLQLEISNVGGMAAQQVTLILGGGSGSGSPDPEGGEQGTGGLTGGGGDFANFAPLGGSNVRFLGSLTAQEKLQANMQLIVNSSTKPGAYPLRLSLSYLDEKGNRLTDEQVISLLVYAPPRLEITTYRPLDPFFVGQPGILPVQVVNLDRNSIMLGRLVVGSAEAMVENGEMLIGFLDPGGFFTHDAMVFPDRPGPLQVRVQVGYTDDFGDSQFVEQIFDIEVMDAPELPPEGEGPLPGEGEFPIDVPAETFWQRVLRFVRGFLGLDSAPLAPSGPEEPMFEGPPPGESGPAG